MRGPTVSLAAILTLACALIVGCAQSTPTPPPTKAAAPAPTKAVEPTKAPAAAPTVAPAAPTKVAPTQPAQVKKVDFPEKGKTITIVVPYGAGGGLDMNVRLLASYLEKELGTSFVVVNKPGAGTQIGVTEVLGSKPDGYTIGMSNMVPAIISYMDPQRKATYSRKDFQLIAMHSAEAIAIGVSGSGAYKDLKDLVNAAKAKPESVKVGTSGLMADSHVAIVLTEKAADVKFGIVNFDSGALSVSALVGGHIDACFTSINLFVPHVKTGALRVAAVLDKQESEFLPGVKTAEAQGYKVYGAADHFLFGPAGMPKEIVDTLSQAIKRSYSAEGYAQKLKDVMTSTKFMDPRETETYWDAQEAQVRTFMSLFSIK